MACLPNAKKVGWLVAATSPVPCYSADLVPMKRRVSDLSVALLDLP
jgi:hypothetical protein